MSKRSDEHSREEAAQALFVDDRLIHQIAQLSPVQINVFDIQAGRDVYVGPDVENMLGYRRDEIARMEDPFAIWHPEDINDFRQYLACSRMAADGEINECEYRVWPREGDWRWLLTRGMPFARSDSGEVQQIITATTDITRRKEAERRLAYQALVLENVHDAVVATDAHLIVTGWNPAAERIYGWTAGEALGRDVREIVRSELAASKRDEVLRLLAETGHQVVETVHHKKDRTAIHVEGSVIAIRDANGVITGYVSAHRDISARKRIDEASHRAHEDLDKRVAERTEQLRRINEKLMAEIDERKKAEEQLRRSEAFLAEGQRLTHTGSWAWNVETGHVSWSQEQFRIFGFDPDGPPPDSTMYLELIHPEDRSFIQNKLAAMVREPREDEWDCRVVTCKEGVRHVHNAAHPVFKSGKLTEYIGTTMDTTERWEADERLQKARADLANLSRLTALGELAATIAHEINQPLAAVVTNAHACCRWLDTEPPNISEAHSAAARIVRDANRGSAVVSRIRSFLKRENPPHEALQIANIMQEVVNLLESEARTFAVWPRIDTERDLPLVVADPVQLQQVLINLVMNAFEAMRAVPDAWRVVALAARRHNTGSIVVSVRDTGSGFDPRHRDRLFDAFYTTKAEGMGMGLAISRSIVEAHGGRIWVTPNQDRGETFYFTLPIFNPVSRG